MEQKEKTVDVLNDLISINNDRVEGYTRAAADSRDIDVDLQGIFKRMAEQSRQYAAELTSEVVKLGGEPNSGTTAAGKIYRAWMDVKATFTGKDRHSLLASCEFGEDAAQRAYNSALDADKNLAADIRELISTQKTALRTSHDLIKKYRDMHELAK